MKKYILLLVAFASYNHIFSQARIATADYQKAPQTAVVADIPYPEGTVSKAIDDQLGKMGYKGKDTKGFLTYKSVRMAQLGPDTYDLYFKVERKSKKEKDFSTVTMLVSSGYEKFITESGSPVMDNAKIFLDSQLVIVAAYDLENQVIEQETEVKKGTKKMKSLTDDAADLQKKKEKLEKEIEENLKAQEAQKSRIRQTG